MNKALLYATILGSSVCFSQFQLEAQSAGCCCTDCTCPPGPQGPTGAQGTPGIQGSLGASGAPGVQGVPGSTGSIGSTGSTISHYLPFSIPREYLSKKSFALSK